MKIFIICSKHFYHKVEEIKKILEASGHEITFPNCFEDPMKEERLKKVSDEEHRIFKQDMMKLHEPKVKENDAVLVLNFEKNGIPNYIGGATFMEIVKAWELDKKIFFHNPIPECIFTDELRGINPLIINGDLSKLNPKNIEVEIRSFISKEEYEKLLEFFSQNAEFVKEDLQETIYFDCKEDFRIQQGNKESKIWMKTGVGKEYDINDGAREETEIQIQKEDFDKFMKIFNTLGLDTEIKWLRKRNQFNWNGISVCVDYTKGYGYILELEKMGNEENKEVILEELKNKLREIGIRETPKEIFTQKYCYYKNNWEELIK